jgi:tRNA-dihydrouridine synthase A
MSKDKYSRKFCVAPMMGYTTPHARKLYRILSQKTFLFTEMIAASTMLHSKTKDLIIENDLQNPIALQVGGSDIDDLALCSKIAKSYNYDEINLNVGCPSKAVQKGSFGACLMQDKKLVRACLETMQNASDIEVTMKCRIGLGNDLNYDYFSTFIDEIVQSGINIIYVHARNAILNGISPKGNRSIPRLNYEFVKKIKKEHPHVQFILNGGIDSLDKAYALSKEHDGVMLGRLIQNNPFCLGKVDKLFINFKSEKNLNKKIILDYFNYIKPKIGNDSIFRLLSPLLQIFFGIPDSKKLKTEIHQQIKDQEIDNLESLFLQFINLQKKAILS